MLSLILYLVSLIALAASLVMALTDLFGLTDFGLITYLPAGVLIFFLGLLMLSLLILDRFDLLAVKKEGY